MDRNAEHSKRQKVMSDQLSDHDASHDEWGKNQPKPPRQNELSRSSSWLSPDGRNPYSQTTFFQKSMCVCFVCGNGACEDNTVSLYSRSPRSQPDAPFFPFLEYHDPAPGADPMKDDWSVVACFVCNALLSQQWESFERGRMPISKRLYWLKRPSGCEIRQPVSQIELEEILNEHSRDNYEERDDYESDDETGDPTPHQQPRQRKNRSVSPDPVLKQSEERKRPLTATSKCKPSSSETALKENSLVCYSCGKSDMVQSSICPVHCKPSYEQMRAGVPYYPDVLDQAGASGSAVLCNSITFMCITCLPKYKPEWHLVQQDFLKQDASKSVLPRIPLPELVLCYLCGCNVSTKYNDGLLHTLSMTGKENKFFKKLSPHKPILGSVPLTFGFTYLCPKCYPRFSKIEERTENNKPDIEQENKNAKK